MTHGRTRTDHAGVHPEIDYQLELARGASIIASMLSIENVTTAIAETITGFISVHGARDLNVFIQLLTERLVRRNRPDAAAILAAWKTAPSAPGASNPRARHHCNSSR